jgi:hypothetical protein
MIHGLISFFQTNGWRLERKEQGVADFSAILPVLVISAHLELDFRIDKVNQRRATN